MALSIDFVILPDEETAQIPKLYRVVYDGEAVISKQEANPLEVKTYEPALLEEYLGAYKEFLTNYLASLTSYEQACSQEMLQANIASYALAYYFKNLTLLSVPVVLPEKNMEEL